MATPALCFLCDQNPRVAGDFICRSCKEEHKYCYECGERERNYPFKLCTQCYQTSRRASGPAVTALATSTAAHSKYQMPMHVASNVSGS